MIELANVSKIGVGTYRMGIKNKNHFDSLSYCADKKINLIDTSSNYLFGDSERLISNLWKEVERKDFFLISKAGYIQGNDLETYSFLYDQGKSIKISDNFYYSLDESFLEMQINASLERLQTDYLDGFLLHNPEYYFNQSDNPESFCYELLSKSLDFLEGLVNKGVIRYYGISSNVIPNGEIILSKIFEKIKNKTYFRLIQFPYNLVENDALNKTEANKNSLIDFCKKNDLVTISNRPLNTSYKGSVIRIADYSNEIENVDLSEEKDLFDKLIYLINEKLLEYGETSKANDYAPIKFFIENRKKISNPEAVYLGVNNHLIPFIQKLHFNNDDIIFLIQKLTKFWVCFSKKLISERSYNLKKKLIVEGKISKDDNRDISLIACEKYLEDGIDHILVGLRKKQYVDMLVDLL